MKLPRFLSGLYGLFCSVGVALMALAASLFAIPGDILDRVRMLALELAPKLARDIKARRLAFIARFDLGLKYTAV